MNFMIISYCDHIRTDAHINHARYAAQHGHTYIFDISPTQHTHFSAKIEKIKKLLSLTEWLFWLDDDAYFIDFDKDIADYIEEGKELIFCASPKDSEIFTWISSGNFFLRNTPAVHALLDACLTTDLNIVKEWWNPETLGYFTNGDQDAIIYQMHNHPDWLGKEDKWTIHPFYEFNSRPRHFLQEPNKHFLVHFVGSKKHLQALKFSKDMALPESLCPTSAPEVNNKYHPSEVYTKIQPTAKNRPPRIKRFLRKLGLIKKV